VVTFAPRDVTAALPVNNEPTLAKRPDTFSARHNRQLGHAATSTSSTRSSGTGSPRSRRTSSWRSDGFTNIRQGLFTILALADAAGKAGHFSDHIAVFAGYKSTCLVMMKILVWTIHPQQGQPAEKVRAADD